MWQSNADALRTARHHLLSICKLADHALANSRSGRMCSLKRDETERASDFTSLSYASEGTDRASA